MSEVKDKVTVYANGIEVRRNNSRMTVYEDESEEGVLRFEFNTFVGGDKHIHVGGNKRGVAYLSFRLTEKAVDMLVQGLVEYRVKKLKK